MTLDLARWQFALTLINHFFFVPVTIGLAFLTALLQTTWHRRKNPEYLRLRDGHLHPVHLHGALPAGHGVQHQPRRTA